jgi:hypothetical protein
MKPRLEPGAEVVGELMAEARDDLQLAGDAMRRQCIAEPRDQVEAALRLAGKDPSAQSAVRLAHVFLANRSDLPEEVTITDRSHIVWPLGRRFNIQPRTVKLPPHGAGNARVMLISHRWPRGDRRYLLAIRGETSLGELVKGRVWSRLTGYQWAEPPGLVG